MQAAQNESSTCLAPLIDSDVYGVFDPQQSVARRNVPGGTAPEAVKMQLQNAKLKMRHLNNFKIEPRPIQKGEKTKLTL